MKLLPEHCGDRSTRDTECDPLVAPMARMVGDELGGYLAGLHAANGVRARFGAGVAGVQRRNGGRGTRRRRWPAAAPDLT